MTVAERLQTPICPVCLNPANESHTRYGVRHECCGLHSWGGKPLVSPATHAARRGAHAVFDPLWQEGRMPRRAAYKWLAEALGIPRRECHISTMNEAMANRVVDAVAELDQEDEILPPGTTAKIQTVIDNPGNGALVDPDQVKEHFRSVVDEEDDNE